jgi:hypothetical protein
MRAACIAAALACACTSQPPPPAAPAVADTAQRSCSAHREAALVLVRGAIEANRACKADSDCVSVALAARCFNACTRPMSAAGKAAYEAAVTEANAKHCAAYEKESCPPASSPPCPGAPAPVCKAGSCG